MAKPVNENLRDVRVENEHGDLVPALDMAGEKFSELILAVTSHGKPGSFTLKVDIKPSTAGALAVKAAITTKKPKSSPPESLLWPTPEGNLMADDPRQTKLDLKPVAKEPARELKTVAA